MSITTDALPGDVATVTPSAATTRRFTGRVVLVTGAGSGIGAATARRFVAEGALVVLADINGDAAIAAARNLGGSALAVDLDATDVGAAKAAIVEAEAALGPLDVLVNNAGNGVMGMFVDTDPADWQRVIDANLRSTLACTYAALPGMLKRRRGAIVNVASEAGRGGVFAGATYAAAKAAVLGFTKSIALESANRGVRCNAVAPGPIDTPMLSGLIAQHGDAGAQVRQMMVDASRMRRAGTPDEVAAAIAFLASDDASYITGETVAVSGGVSMW